MSTRKFLIVSGVLAALIYTVTVILGGLLWPEYSHLAQPVSELIGATAPNKALLDPFFGAYNLLVIACGVGLYQLAATGNANSRRLGYWGAGILVAEGILGLPRSFSHKNQLPRLSR